MVFAIVLVFLAVVLCGIVIISKTKKKKGETPSERRVYAGAIRTTDHEGNDVLIVRKDDGSFEIVRESKAE